VAVKMMLVGKLNEKTMKDFQTELKILRKMHSNHIICFLGGSRRVGHPAIIMEFMDSGNLTNLLMSQTTYVGSKIAYW
jgi:serine/threonine protein kinase